MKFFWVLCCGAWLYAGARIAWLGYHGAPLGAFITISACCACIAATIAALEKSHG